jgi:parallel beta-helix repeat protein
MSAHHSLTLFLLPLVALGCSQDGPTSPVTRTVAALSARASTHQRIVVGHDRARCGGADFSSIQAAVDAADPGETILVCPGTYNEWVVITKDDLRLLAKGKPGDVVLDGQDAMGTSCTPTSTAAVHCAAFLLDNAHGNLIEGFVVRRYWEAGIWLRRGSSGNTIRNNVTTESPHHDGIQVAGSNDNVIEHNVAIDNPVANACGINIAGGSAGNLVRHNRLVNNEWGIQIVGTATATTRDNVIFNNTSLGNRGNGIRNLAFTSGTVIAENHAVHNGFMPSPLTSPPGGVNTAAGIRIASGTGIVVRRNQASHNRLVDVLEEAAATATFEHNRCGTSSPDGLCHRSRSSTAP